MLEEVEELTLVEILPVGLRASVVLWLSGTRSPPAVWFGSLRAWGGDVSDGWPDRDASGPGETDGSVGLDR